MIAIRYLLIFATPILAAVLLFYGTLPLRAEAHRLSAEFIDLMVTSNAETVHDFLISAERIEARQVYSWIKLSAIATMLVAGGVSALLVRSEDSIERRANLLTTMVAGFGTAHLVINFGVLKWLEFGGWVIGGLLVASCVLVAPRAMRRCDLDPRSTASECQSSHRADYLL